MMQIENERRARQGAQYLKELNKATCTALHSYYFFLTVQSVLISTVALGGLRESLLAYSFPVHIVFWTCWKSLFDRNTQQP